MASTMRLPVLALVAVLACGTFGALAQTLPTAPLADSHLTIQYQESRTAEGGRYCFQIDLAGRECDPAESKCCATGSPTPKIGLKQLRMAIGAKCTSTSADTAALSRFKWELNGKRITAPFSRAFNAVRVWRTVNTDATLCVTIPELLVGLGEARLPHWQKVVSAAQFTRAQALLINDLQECVQARLQVARAQRAALSAALAGASAALAAAPAAPAAVGSATAGAGATGAAGAGAAVAAAATAAAATKHTELLVAFESNVAAEAGLIQLSSLVIIAALTPGQFFRSFSASWPYPLSVPAVCDVLEAQLRLEGAGAFADEAPPDG